MAWRPKTLTSLFGTIRPLMAYYHCASCGCGRKPWDQALGLTSKSLTPAAEQLSAQAGVLASFAEASQRTLVSMSGLRISESTVERASEEAGARLQRKLNQGQTQGPRQSWEWQRDAEGQTCAYIGVDHTGVRQQGPQGSRADGRMAAVGIVYNPRSPHDATAPPSGQVRYLSGLHYDLPELGRQLRREAEAVGLMQAQRQIALTDGGAGLEVTPRTFFPSGHCALEFWHAQQLPGGPAPALHPQDEAPRKKWLDGMCHALKHEGGRAVLSRLQAMDATAWTALQQEMHRRQVGYFTNHAHRMDYPTYLARGWQIGSGPVESACKTVVGNRLKGGGMRWGLDGSDSVCHLRAAYLSEPSCWDALWNQKQAHLQN